jgi:hypothetical protein
MTLLHTECYTWNLITYFPFPSFNPAGEHASMLIFLFFSFVYWAAAWTMDLDLGSIVLADIEHQLRLTMDVTVNLSFPTDSDSTTSPSAQKLVFSQNTWIERGNDIWIRFHLRWERLSGGLECIGPSLLEALGGAIRNSEVKCPRLMFVRDSIDTSCSSGRI